MYKQLVFKFLWFYRALGRIRRCIALRAIYTAVMKDVPDDCWLIHRPWKGRVHKLHGYRVFFLHLAPKARALWLRNRREKSTPL